jgi:hypothetical protein
MLMTLREKIEEWKRYVQSLTLVEKVLPRMVLLAHPPTKEYHPRRESYTKQ